LACTKSLKGAPSKRHEKDLDIFGPQGTSNNCVKYTWTLGERDMSRNHRMHGEIDISCPERGHFG
jgi:hypothetical protein